MPAAPRARTRLGLSSSAEHYLRAILELREENGYARVVDIATRLGLSKGSVSLALGQLEEKGLLRFDPARFPLLTSSGRRIALDVRGRFRIVYSFLTGVLGLPQAQAHAEACRWEHAVSHEAADRMLDLLRFREEDPRAHEVFEEFQEFHRSCAAPGACAQCAAKGPVESFCPEDQAWARPVKEGA